MKNVFYRILAVLSIIAVFNGCVSEINVQAVRPYENRYSDENDLIEAAKSVKLADGESVWLLTNSTLKRLLINLNKK